MIISKLHYISQGNSPKEHLENIQKACTSGAELVQLNIKDISKKKFLKIATQAREITARFQTRLIVNGFYQIAKEVKADGVHFDKADNSSTEARKHLFSWQLVGATANNIEECEKLLAQEVDYIFLSPFRETASENNANTILGLNGFTAVVETLDTKTPIIGVGAITPDDVKEILKTGISGIAVSEAVTNDFNIIKIFNNLLGASSTDEQRHSFK